MSLFGGGTSLFGNTSTAGTGASNTTSTGSTLFGNLGQSQTPAQPQGSGLFSGSATKSFFGQPASTQAQQPQATAPATTTGASLFGASTLNKPQPTIAANPAPLGTSIFGNPSAPTAQTTQTNTNGQQAGTAAPQPGGALFDALVAKSKKQAEGEGGADLPTLQLGLGDLQQRLGKLGRPSQLGPDQHHQPRDGSAHYLLAASGVDPGAALRDLTSLGLRAGRPERPSGPPSGELDVETYLSNLQTKTTLSMIADGLERSVRDFDSFLEDNVMMEWEAQRQRIYEHFGIKPREGANGGGAGTASGPGGGAPSLTREPSGGAFGRSKRSRAGPGTPNRTAQRSSVFGRSTTRSVIGAPSRVGQHPSQFVDVEMVSPAGSLDGPRSMIDRYLADKQKKFALKVRGLNDSRLEGLPYPVMHEFAEVTEKSGDVHGPKIVEAYRAMASIIGENPEADPADRSATVRERQFAKTYIHTAPKSPESLVFRKHILSGATRYLERRFFEEIESTIAKSPVEANLGGRPDVVSKIRAYIRVRASKRNLVPDNTELQQVHGEYVWAILFYLLRSGHVNEAAKYVNDNQNHFRSIDRTFSGYINSYASSEDRRLKRPMQERCNNEYTQRARNAPENSIDPYRMACYKIVGRCDLSNRSLDGLKTDVNDWIWLQFNLARELDRSAEFANESYGLSELQASIQEIGNKHFSHSKTGNGPEDGTGAFGMFFFLQILAGMYEAAIAYLYAYSRTDAVHFAIALEYYGLLRPASALAVENELKSYNTRGMLQINFAPLVGLYTQDFRAADVVAAVDYIVLICLNMDDSSNESDRQQAALCHDALRALVLETREFSKLIGDIRPDGWRIKGVIEERGKLIALDDEGEFLRTISLEAARAAEDSGRTTDAVLLNHLAGDYDAVLALVARTVGEAISMGTSSGSGALTQGADGGMKLAPVKPRLDGADAEAQLGTSLSLAAIDDPIELARTMLTMYERDQMFLRKIGSSNRLACNILLQMSDIKGLVETGEWTQALDKIRTLNILPLDAKGDPSIIRSCASTFSTLAQPVASNVPNLVSWTTTCCINQRIRMATGQVFTGNEATARVLAAELKQMTVDLTAYTSQLRYRFPPDVLEALARAAAD